jgi:hypothetical protein
MFAPGPPDAPFQVLDVRDLAGFMLDRIESAATGVYGVVGPSAPCTINDVLVAARDAARAETSFVWGEEELLREYGEQVSGWFPMWAPHLPSDHTYDASKAVRAGLRRRRSPRQWPTRSAGISSVANPNSRSVCQRKWSANS